MEFVEYACIFLLADTDLEVLENHLSMNGYDFGIDKSKSLVFVFIDELEYVKTIMADRHIPHYTKVY